MGRAQRSGGRAARLAERTAPVAAVNPCPPGQIGGQYRPLSDPDMKAVIDTAFRILAEIGMSEVPDDLQQQALKKGAELNSLGRLTFSRAMMEDIIDGAAKRFVFHGRDPAHDFEVGGDRVYYGTAGAAVQTLDLDTGAYRPSTLQDLADFARLGDTLENLAWFTRCCVATDIPDLLDLDINTAYAIMCGTTKPIGTSFALAESVEKTVAMLDMAMGGEGKFAKRPVCKAHISPIISPLRYGADAVEVVQACIQNRMPINSIIAAQSGATAPAPLAGMLAQTTAETLAALAMVNVFERGFPMVFSNWPFVIDLRTGAFSGSGGEISVLNAASAQISNHLGLPSGVASSMADAKAVDAQMGSEKAMSAVAAGLAGANMVYESAGMSASLLGVSFEAFIVDNEMLSHIQRIVRGIEVNEETLGFETILQTVTGEGHYLGSGQTMDAMQRDYFYPRLANRDDPRSWFESGKPDIWSVANMQAKEILANHRPNYINKDVDARIRAAVNILDFD